MVTSEVTLDLWRKIDAIDFSAIRKKLKRNKPGWSALHTDAAIMGYKMYLFISSQYKEICAPHPSIDEVWHTHILFTQQYHQDCQSIFGRYMHHRPTEADPNIETLSQEEKGKSYLNTRRLIVLNFGPKADPEILFTPFIHEIYGWKKLFVMSAKQALSKTFQAVHHIFTSCTAKSL
jgi:hypothetical protein